MPNRLNSVLKRYDYRLQPESIANLPAMPRDSARLLAYDRTTRQTGFDIFRNLGKYLPKNAVLVFNQTKVWPARLIARKPTGGKVELLYISHSNRLIKTLANRPLAAGTSLALLSGRSRTLKLQVMAKKGQFYFLRPSFPIGKTPEILKRCGVTPLPPYIKNSPLSERQKRQEYQSVFAKSGLSVAAPTASLHFTKPLINQLKKQGIAIKFLQLDVGLGTFAPLKEQNLDQHKLHREFYKIDKATADFLNMAKRQGKVIIAVGTTVVRTLESASNRRRRLTKLTGTTELFIQEGYNFNFVDGIITNFHVPRSSLLMLVSAFAGRKTILDLYRRAIGKKFRFFSFGDGMLLL